VDVLTELGDGPLSAGGLATALGALLAAPARDDECYRRLWRREPPPPDAPFDPAGAGAAAQVPSVGNRRLPELSSKAHT
jgi:hypothetical protein